MKEEAVEHYCFQECEHFEAGWDFETVFELFDPHGGDTAVFEPEGSQVHEFGDGTGSYEGDRDFTAPPALPEVPAFRTAAPGADSNSSASSACCKAEWGYAARSGSRRWADVVGSEVHETDSGGSEGDRDFTAQPALLEVPALGEAGRAEVDCSGEEGSTRGPPSCSDGPQDLMRALLPGGTDSFDEVLERLREGGAAEKRLAEFFTLRSGKDKVAAARRKLRQAATPEAAMQAIGELTAALQGRLQAAEAKEAKQKGRQRA